MSESHAEQVDSDVLGDPVDDDEMPGADYPPQDPVAVDDPNIVDHGMIAKDDVESREKRLRREDDVGDPDAGQRGPGLIDTNENPDLDDEEPESIADTGDDDPSPEAAALHVERPPTR